MVVHPDHGILLVDKEAGWTSHDAVGRVRRLAGTRRVGHAGTLDPMATGLLVLGINQGTRLLTHFVGLPKTYEATIRLGRATTTDDAEGEPIGVEADAAGISDARIEESLEALRGDILQVPSSVSAIKVDGRRAYARVRAGEEVELAARPVTVSRLDVLSRREEGPFTDLDVVVDCSSGTYVRALARDLGDALGVGGHLSALHRTRVGPFRLEDALVLPPRGEGDEHPVVPLLPLGEAAAAVMPPLPLADDAVVELGHGRRPRTDAPVRGRAAALDSAGRLVAVVEVSEEGLVVPKLVIPEDTRS